MKTIKTADEIQKNYTGIIEWADGDKEWYRNGEYHREDGPAIIRASQSKEWWLDGKYIWHSEYNKFDLTNEIVYSKEQHPEYSTVQVWKYLDKNGIQEQIIIPGMEAWIIE